MAKLIRIINTSQFPSPSPDPSGIAYIDHLNSFIVSDSEVDEIPNLFTGNNLFTVNLAGDLTGTSSTPASSFEPTGIAYNLDNKFLYLADDDRNRIYQINPGGDGLYNTGDDVTTSFDTLVYGIDDLEDVTYSTKTGDLFLVDGVNTEVYRVTTSGALVSQFDTASFGLQDVEGIYEDPVTGNLFMVGFPHNLVFEVTPTGNLVRTIDISEANPVKPGGITIGPSSVDPTQRSIYIVDRGIDNNVDPTENDGQIYEFSLGGSQGYLSFSAPTFTVNEDGTVIASVQVIRTGGSSGAVTATISLADGTAKALGDYNSSPITVGFADGDTTTKTILIPIVNDTLVEGNETINLSLGNATGGATIGTQYKSVLTIVDNDIVPPTPGVLSFSAPSYSVNENGTVIASVQVTRTEGSSGAVSAVVTPIAGTAIASADFNTTPITVSFANGDTATKTITIPIVNDTLVEGNETINLVLGNPTGGATLGTQSTAVLTIVDNDLPAGVLEFSAPYFTVNEDGKAVVAVQVTRAGGSAGAVSARIDLTNGTATAPGDYNSNSITVSFANGDAATKTINIPIVNDKTVESNETINLSLSNVTGGATIGSQRTATLTIIDDDTSTPRAGVISFSAPTFSIREDGTAIAAVQVLRTGGKKGAVSATITLTNGTATAPGDYTSTPIVVSFGNNDDDVKTITIPIVNDTAVEANETINLSLGNATGGAVVRGQTSAVLTIVDNDSPSLSAGTLAFSAPTFSVNEDGTAITSVQVTRTGGSSGAISAVITPSNGTGATPGDYNNSPLTVNFADGELTKTVVIPIVDDTLVEGNESINLSLGSLTGGASLGSQSTAVLTIVDNDSPPPVLSTIAFSAPSYLINENGTAIAQVQVTRTGNSVGAASAIITLSGGTATSGEDYNNSPITVNFADGDAVTKTITIPVLKDTLTEGNETVNLELTSPTGATIGSQSQATLTIVDNPPAILSFSAPTFSVNENGEAIAAVQVTRTGGSVGAVGATITLGGGTATAGDDYNTSPITVSFADGDMATKTITMPIVKDFLVETDETVNLTLSDPTGDAVLGQSQAELTIKDNKSVFYVSTAANGTVSGSGFVTGISIQFADEDILAYNDGTGTWSMYFDGSDIGLSSLNLRDFHINDDGTVLMSFNNNATLAGVGGTTFTAAASDIVKFTPTSTGTTTAGTFEMYFNGANVGLDATVTSGEKIDAIAMTRDGKIIISTEGSYTVPGVSTTTNNLVTNRDLLVFTPTSLGENTAGTWSLYFDAEDVGLNAATENPDSVWVDDAGKVYLSTTGDYDTTVTNGSANTVTGIGSDVFMLSSTRLGEIATGSYSSFWNPTNTAGSGSLPTGIGIDGFSRIV